MRWHGALAAVGVLLVLAIAGTAAAQEPEDPTEQPPPVLFEDQVLEDPIEPLSSPGSLDMTIGVGCDALETAETQTSAEIKIADVPGFVNGIVSPASAAWDTGPEDCPSEDPVHEAQTRVSISFTQNAPAFEPVTLRLEMTVQKEPPIGPARSYGPFVANVTATPGYFDHYNRRVEDSIQEARADEAAPFEVTIENFSNGETRFELRTAEAAGDVVVEVEPDELVLEPREVGTLNAHVSLEAPEQIEERTQRSVTLEIRGTSTHPEGGQARPTTAGVMVEFEPADGGPGLANVPALPIVAAACTLIVASLGNAWLRRD